MTINMHRVPTFSYVHTRTHSPTCLATIDKGKEDSIGNRIIPTDVRISTVTSSLVAVKSGRSCTLTVCVCPGASWVVLHGSILNPLHMQPRCSWKKYCLWVCVCVCRYAPMCMYVYKSRRWSFFVCCDVLSPQTDLPTFICTCVCPCMHVWNARKKFRTVRRKVWHSRCPHSHIHMYLYTHACMSQTHSPKNPWTARTKLRHSTCPH